MQTLFKILQWQKRINNRNKNSVDRSMKEIISYDRGCIFYTNMKHCKWFKGLERSIWIDISIKW